MDDGNLNYRRFLDGDDGAISLLVAEYRRGLYHFLLGLVHDPELADDLTEDTFVKLLVKRPRNTEKSSFRTWLYTIGRNLAFDHFRRQGRRRALDGADFAAPEWALPSPEELYGKETDAALLRTCLDRLENRQRESAPPARRISPPSRSDPVFQRSPIIRPRRRVPRGGFSFVFRKNLTKKLDFFCTVC